MNPLGTFLTTPCAGRPYCLDSDSELRDMIWSLAKLSPDVSYLATMPLLVKLHIINAFLIIAVFPFTRLVHILVAPNPYFWRKTQVVLWNWDRTRIRGTD